MTNNVQRFMISISAGAMLAIGANAAVAQTNPAIGTWEMNVARSTVDAKDAARSETFIFANSAKGITLTTNITAANGKKSTHISDPAPWDGVAHAVSDSSDHDSIMVKPVGAGLVSYSFMKAGAVTNSGTLAVSKDGSMLTIAGARTSAKGDKVFYNTVFDRK
jgi:hypothetical protein